MSGLPEPYRAMATAAPEVADKTALWTDLAAHLFAVSTLRIRMRWEPDAATDARINTLLLEVGRLTDRIDPDGDLLDTIHASAAALALTAHPAGVCRVCGCTADRACSAGCSWANWNHTLCTACVGE